MRQVRELSGATKSRSCSYIPWRFLASAAYGARHLGRFALREIQGPRHATGSEVRHERHRSLFGFGLHRHLTRRGRKRRAGAVVPDPLKQVLLDPRVVAEATGSLLVMGTVQKAPSNPLFQADKPWENSLNNLYPNVVFDPERKLFRLWYKCVLADKDAIAKMMPPATVHDVGWFLLYAESADGMHWTKPDLGLIGFDGSRKTNIVARDTPNAGVFRDPHDADPARRFKMLYDVGLGKLRVRTSPDGLRWSQPQELQGFTAYTGDTHNNAFWDERLGKYIAITRFYLGERLVARSESDDFLKWQRTQLALRSTFDEGRRRQLYCMPSFPYAGGYLGFLMPYNAGTDRTVDCELAWSPDSVQWTRVLPGTPFIPRGPKGAYDAGCIYAQSGAPILKDGRLTIFYGGSEVVHRGWKRHCLPCLATLRPDGFAGYRADAATPGLVTTAAVRALGLPLQVSADAAGGSLQVAVLSDRGVELAAGEPVVGDVTDALVRWRGGFQFESLRGQTVRLQFKLQEATLYAFRGVELVPPEPPETAGKRPTWEELHPGQPRKAVRHTATFTADAEGWQAHMRGEHHRESGGGNGFFRVFRADADAFAVAAPQASGGRFSGKLSETYGGTGITLSFRARSPVPAGTVHLELFAGDLGSGRIGCPN